MTQELEWSPDIFPGYFSAPLEDATLVRSDHAQASSGVVVLHVHGYNDYFFHTHLADALGAEGHAVYGVDMPRAGRSLRQEDIPHFFADVNEQSGVLSAACDAIAHSHPGARIVVHAHSTGALQAAIWAADAGAGRIAGLVLNSPLFGLKATGPQRVLARAVPAIAAVAPRMVLVNQPSYYSALLLTEEGGAWGFNPEWKRPAGLPARAGWLAAVQQGWSMLHSGLDLTMPVLVARAAQGGPDVPTNQSGLYQDTIVDVEATATWAPTLGPKVTQLVIDRALHDITLSTPGPRAEYFKALAEWIGSLSS